MAEALLSSKTPAQIAAEAAAVKTAVGSTPLSRDAFIDPITGAERPLNNPVTNPTNYAKDLATGQSNAVINKQIDAIAHDTTLSLAEKQQKMSALQVQKMPVTGITPEMRQQIIAERDLPQNIRDLSLEQATANKMGISNPQGQDLEDMYEMAYGSKLSKAISQGEIYAGEFSAQKLAELGITAERMQKLMEMETDPQRRQNLANLYEQLQNTAAQGAQAGSVLGATPKPTNEMMGVLSEALNAKNNFKQQKLGASDLFSMAGLSGYEVLAQSLGQRGNEMKQKLQSAAATIAATGGAMASTYKAIADNYDKIRDDYDKQVNRLLKIDEDARSYERQLEIMEKTFQNDKEMVEFKAQLEEKKRQAEADAMNDLYGDAGTIGGVKASDSTWSKIFDLGAIGDWCGVFASKVSTAPKVGNSWAEKRTKIDTQINPSMGDKLLIPVGVKTDKGNGAGEYGHVAVVVSYNPKSNTVVVVESNRDGRQNSGAGKGIITMGTYNLDKLKAQYGDDWGFAKGDLKKDYLDRVTKYLTQKPEKKAEVTPEMVKTVTSGLASFTSASNVAKAVGSLAPSKPTTPAARYEAATGQRLTDDVAKKMREMSTQGLEAFLANLEAKAETERKKAELAGIKLDTNLAKATGANTLGDTF
jgi:surface antigen